MSFLPYPPPPEPGWYDDDATVMSQPASEPSLGADDSAAVTQSQSAALETSTPQVAPVVQNEAAQNASDLRNDDEEMDWDGTVLSSAFTMKQPKREYVLDNEQTGQQVVVDRSVLLGRKPSADVPEGAKAVKLEDPTRTISRNHAAISFDQNGTLWIEDYGSLNGTYIIRDDVETKVERQPMELEAPCTVRIGDQFFTFSER